MLSNPTIVGGSILWICLTIFILLKKEWSFLVPLLLVIVGVFSNVLVMSLNNNKMPVWVPSYFGNEDSNCLISNKTRLNFLADRFYVCFGIAVNKDDVMGFGRLLSIGDILFYLGFFMLILLVVFQLFNFLKNKKPSH